MTMTISTDRLVLRRFDESDAGSVAAVMQQPEVIGKLLWVPSPYTMEDAHHFVTKIARQDAGTFAITFEGDLVGSISVGERLGYWLAPKVWGRG